MTSMLIGEIRNDKKSSLGGYYVANIYIYKYSLQEMESQVHGLAQTVVLF